MVLLCFGNGASGKAMLPAPLPGCICLRGWFRGCYTRLDPSPLRGGRSRIPHRASRIAHPLFSPRWTVQPGWYTMGARRCPRPCDHRHPSIPDPFMFLRPPALPTFRRYAVAFAAVVVAWALRTALNPWVGADQPLFLWFVGAVVFSAWYGGLGPGLFATLLSALLADVFLFQPHPRPVHAQRRPIRADRRVRHPSARS